MPKKTLALFDKNDIPAQARYKHTKKLKIDDLHPAQKAKAKSSDLTAIKEDGVVTILAPAGNVAEAAQALVEALAQQTN